MSEGHVSFDGSRGSDAHRTRVLASLLALSLFAVSVMVSLGSTSATAVPLVPATTGQWSAPFTIPLVGIHATLMHTGEVLFFERPRSSEGSESWVFDPETGTWTDVTLDVTRDLFCGGHSVLPDGRVFVSGGQVPGAPDGRGVVETNLFDPATRQWSEGPDMAQARWYPTNVQLASGATLILSGQQDWGMSSTSVERYDPWLNSITQLPASAAKLMPNYPRSHLLPTGQVFVSGPAPRTGSLDLTTNTWTYASTLLTMRWGGTSVLLPGLNRVLALGGTNRLGVTANTAEIIDLSASAPDWRTVASMASARVHANAVLLPDGTALVVGGGTGGLYRGGVTSTELFDPVTETWTTVASQTAPRIYHSTALLLPDGRILSSGMDSGPYQRTAEIFSPPYLFQGSRPTISTAPEETGYGDAIAISSPEASSIDDVVLMRAGSVTHSFDFEQRYLGLTFSTTGPGALTATAPATAFEAPPGWYMLFLLDGGVPSVASWIHVVAS